VGNKEGNSSNGSTSYNAANNEFYCQYRVTINYTSQQRFRNIYKNNRYACVTAILSQFRNLKNSPRYFLKWTAFS